MRVMLSAEINRGPGEIWGQSVSQSLKPPQSAVVHILYWFGSYNAGVKREVGEDSSFLRWQANIVEGAIHCIVIQTYVSHANHVCSALKVLSGLWHWIDLLDTVDWFSLDKPEEGPRANGWSKFHLCCFIKLWLLGAWDAERFQSIQLLVFIRDVPSR